LSEAAGVANHCRNCDFPFGEAAPSFCPSCGQDTLNHPPTFWEFVHEFITHYVALEGKLWKTMLLLFFKPAELTREYRAGRKLRYISPLRLYITASFLFFLVVKVVGWGDVVKFDDKADPAAKAEISATLQEAKTEMLTSMAAAQAEIETSTRSDAQKEAAKAKLAKAKSVIEGAAGSAIIAVDADKKPVKKAPGGDGANVNFNCEPNETVCGWFKQRLKGKWEGRKGADIVHELKAGALSNVPYALFMLLPLFALLTKLIYVGRGLYFGEHMVYALHVHAFTFFALLLMALTPEVVGGLVFCAVMVYYFVAMQRFFGGRWWANVIRYGIVGTVYPLLLTLVAMLVLFFVVLI
jgi:Protein of unknown function (DUF3667)